MNPDRTTAKTMTNQQAISLLILNEISNGVPVREAIDQICGKGASEKMIGELYEQLRK